jgi:hypothetical protein
MRLRTANTRRRANEAAIAYERRLVALRAFIQAHGFEGWRQHRAPRAFANARKREALNASQVPGRTATPA